MQVILYSITYIRSSILCKSDSSDSNEIFSTEIE